MFKNIAYVCFFVASMPVIAMQPYSSMHPDEMRKLLAEKDAEIKVQKALIDGLALALRLEKADYIERAILKNPKSTQYLLNHLEDEKNINLPTKNINLPKNN